MRGEWRGRISWGISRSAAGSGAGPGAGPGAGAWRCDGIASERGHGASQAARQAEQTASSLFYVAGGGSSWYWVPGVPGFGEGRVHTGHILTTYPDSLPTPHPSVTSERIHSTTHTHPRQPIRTLPHTSISTYFVFVFRWTA